MPIRHKVSTDNWVTEERMGPGDIMFADDLEGCTVVAVKTDFLSRLGEILLRILQSILGPLRHKVLNKALTEFRTATNLGNDLPDYVWLYMADKNAKEYKEDGNNLVREQLKKAHIEPHGITEEKYPLPTRGTEKVELRPGAATTNAILVRI